MNSFQLKDKFTSLSCHTYTAGFFYWVDQVQPYDSGGWNYLAELKKFVNGGMEGEEFINSVSGIVNRGCHNPVSISLSFNRNSVVYYLFCKRCHHSFIPFLSRSHVAQGTSTEDPNEQKTFSAFLKNLKRPSSTSHQHHPQ